MMQHSKGHYVHNTRITNIYSLGNYITIAYSRTTFKSYHLSRGPNFNPQRVCPSHHSLQIYIDYYYFSTVPMYVV